MPVNAYDVYNSEIKRVILIFTIMKPIDNIFPLHKSKGIQDFGILELIMKRS